MYAEPWTLLFADFALVKKKRVRCLKWGDCHFIFCSTLCPCILISPSNKHHNLSYLNFVTILVLLELPHQRASFLLLHLPNWCFYFKVYSYRCMQMSANAACYNIDVFLYDSYKDFFLFPFYWKLRLSISK